MNRYVGESPFFTPIRTNLFEDISEGVRTNEAAERYDLHPNSIRRHLDRFVEEGVALKDGWTYRFTAYGKAVNRQLKRYLEETGRQESGDRLEYAGRNIVVLQELHENPDRPYTDICSKAGKSRGVFDSLEEQRLIAQQPTKQDNYSGVGKEVHRALPEVDAETLSNVFFQFSNSSWRNLYDEVRQTGEVAQAARNIGMPLGTAGGRVAKFRENDVFTETNTPTKLAEDIRMILERYNDQTAESIAYALQDADAITVFEGVGKQSESAFGSNSLSKDAIKYRRRTLEEHGLITRAESTAPRYSLTQIGERTLQFYQEVDPESVFKAVMNVFQEEPEPFSLSDIADWMNTRWTDINQEVTRLTTSSETDPLLMRVQKNKYVPTRDAMMRSHWASESEGGSYSEFVIIDPSDAELEWLERWGKPDTKGSPTSFSDVTIEILEYVRREGPVNKGHIYSALIGDSDTSTNESQRRGGLSRSISSLEDNGFLVCTSDSKYRAVITDSERSTSSEEPVREKEVADSSGIPDRQDMFTDWRNLSDR